jgi:hypothetical protein
MIEAIQPSTAKSLDRAPNPALRNPAVTAPARRKKRGNEHDLTPPSVSNLNNITLVIR